MMGGMAGGMPGATEGAAAGGPNPMEQMQKLMQNPSIGGMIDNIEVLENLFNMVSGNPAMKP